MIMWVKKKKRNEKRLGVGREEGWNEEEKGMEKVVG